MTIEEHETPDEVDVALGRLRRWATFLTHFGILQVGIAIGMALEHWLRLK